jgi:muramoyltetrapeptide carboxypeptidase
LIQAAGFASLHGPMLCDYSRLGQLPACLKQQEILMSNRPLKYELNAAHFNAGENEIAGMVLGGNLSLMNYLTEEMQEDFFDDGILFLEEVGESYHKIDRMLDRMFRSGKLNKVKAFVLGTFQDCAAHHFPLEPADMLKEKIQPNQSVFYGFPGGHAHPSMPFFLGYDARIEKSSSNWVFTQKPLPLIF